MFKSNNSDGLLSELFNRVSSLCHCPPQCLQTTFDPTITLGTNSNFDLENKLRHSTDSLQQKYKHAREASQRVYDTTVTSDQSLVTSLEAAVHDVEMASENLRRTLVGCIEGVRSALEEVKGRTDFHVNRALWGVKFNIKHNFVRGWKRKAEGTINLVTSAFHEIGRRVIRVMKDYETMGRTKRMNRVSACDTENTRLFLLESRLQEKLDLVQEAQRDLMEVNNSYAMGKPLSDDRPFSVVEYDRSTNPVTLIKSRPGERKSHTTELVELSKNMEQNLEGMLGVVEAIVSNRPFNKTEVEELVSEYESLCRRFIHHRYLMADRVIERPLQVINRRMDKVLRLNRSVEDHYITVQETGAQLANLLQVTSKGYWNNVKHIIVMYKEYMINDTMLKSDLYSYATSESTVAAINNVTKFFNSVHSHGVEYRTSLRYLHHSFLNLYQYMLQETTTHALYTVLKEQIQESLRNQSRAAHYIPLFKQLTGRPLGGGYNLSELLMQVNADFPMSDVRGLVRPLETLIEQFVGDARVYSALEEAQRHLQEAISDLNHSLHAFHGGSKVDTAFYR